MNPRRHIHSGLVERIAETVNAGTGQKTKSKSTVAAGLGCLVEARHGQSMATIMGKQAQAAYTISWSTTPLLEEDLFTWTGGPGATSKQYYIRRIAADNTRPTGAYYTAELEERHK